jgi:hypothetical protein
MIQIKNRWTGAVLWEGETLVEADLSEADLYRANLSGANLSRANLSRADLSEADLYRANLSGANLSRANLSRANLSRANLSGANLSRANLSGANLSEADLYKANLSEADLSEADLSGADLFGANLSGANLSGANLSGANLYGANLSRANLSGAKDVPASAPAQTCVSPSDGSFTAWKQCRDGVLVKLLIPEDAKRSNATGRKCRASHAIVLEVIGAEVGISHRDGRIVYRAGETVTCHKWCEDRWVECGGGIHYFITRAEAEEYRY